MVSSEWFVTSVWSSNVSLCLSGLLGGWGGGGLGLDRGGWGAGLDGRFPRVRGEAEGVVLPMSFGKLVSFGKLASFGKLPSLGSGTGLSFGSLRMLFLVLTGGVGLIKPS